MGYTSTLLPDLGDLCSLLVAASESATTTAGISVVSYKIYTLLDLLFLWLHQHTSFKISLRGPEQDIYKA
jgi:hypothetical protein